MEVKEKKENKGALAIARTLLVLCIVYMIGFYVLKYIFPEYLLLAITDENVLKVGTFIESNEAYIVIHQLLLSFVTFFLFVCASKGSFKLRTRDFWYIIIAVVLCKVISIYFVELYVHVSTSCMFLLAWLCKGKLGYTTITFTTHGLLSQFLTQIRGFGSIVYKLNTASAIVLTLECWIWLILFGIVFYLMERRNELRATIHQ